VSIALVAILALSAAFSDLELSREGHPLPAIVREEQVPLAMPELQDTGGSLLLLGVLILLSLLLTLILFIHQLTNPKTRKRALVNLLLLFCLVAIPLALKSPSESPVPATAQPTGEPLPALGPVVVGSQAAEPPDFESAAPPSWALWAMTIGLALLVAGGLVAIGWGVWRYRHPSNPLGQLAEEAQEAIDALEAGADARDTVSRCYVEMSQVLKKQRGIVRQQAMTPREFEESLAEAGLPDEQIGQLTRLFEGVRYGAKVPGEREKRQAVDCLTAIVEVCQSLP
jgi:hypothetical protein